MYVSTWRILRKAREDFVRLRRKLGRVAAREDWSEKGNWCLKQHCLLRHLQILCEGPSTEWGSGRGQIMKGRTGIWHPVWCGHIVGMWVSPWGILDLCHISGLFTGFSWFSLLFLLNWYSIISDSNVYIFPYIFEESCFYLLLQPRHAPHLPLNIPGICQDSVRGCSSKCPADRDGVLSLSLFLKHVFEESYY